MSFSAAIRRAASSAAPVVARSLAGSRLSAAGGLGRRLLLARISGSRAEVGFNPQTSRFSSVAAAKPAADPELVEVIESEIKCAEECDDHDRVEEIPKGFPFEIQDEKGKNVITLRRKYQDEDIEVTVAMPSLVTGAEPDRRKGSEDEDEEGGSGDDSSAQSSLPLTVIVNRAKGGASLEFTCTAYPDEVMIDAMSVRDPAIDDGEVLAYEGPDFSDLDENLQKAFHKYLELRGISASTTNFLHEYMINKDSREYLHWLRNLKEFVAK